MRPSTACVACRNRRRKCEVTKPKERCVYCAKCDVTCSFEAPASIPNGLWSAGHPTSPTSSDGEVRRCQSVSTNLPPLPLCIDLTTIYFQHIHDTFHSLFHPPSTIQDVEDGTLPKVLLFAIISLAARFSNDLFFAGIDPRLRGRPFAQEAEHLLNIREISLTTIQAAVLIGAFCVTEGDPEAEAIYYSIACRNALLLDLPNLPTVSRVDQEVNRRAWWTLNMIDVWSSNGMRLPRNLLPRSDIPYPMLEETFLQLRREDFDLPSSPGAYLEESSSSLLTQMIKLNAILVEITNLNALAASSPHSTYDPTYLSAVDTLTQQLDAWYASLPPLLQDTPANLSRYSALGLAPVFVAVYLGYYHYAQLLYYPFLHVDSDPSPPPDPTSPTSPSNLQDPHTQHLHHHYATLCRTHSTSLLSILYRATSSGATVTYNMVGHVLVIASTIQLHILLFSTSESAISAARARLEHNFAILSYLQTLWPTLDVCFERFREFHNACLRRKEGTFRLDRWMVRFLFEFAKPVGEKDEADEERGLRELRPWSMVELGFSPYSRGWEEGVGCV